MTELNESMMSAFTGLEINDRSTNPFQLSIFNAIKPIARTMVEKRITSVPDETFVYLWALMVAHLWTVRTSDTTLKSESLGNYSYTRDSEKSTKFLAEFEEMMLVLGGGSGAMFVSIPRDTRGDLDGLLRLD